MLLALGVATGAAVASGAMPDLITTTLPTVTVPTATLPTVTVAPTVLPTVTTTLPITTAPHVTTTIPNVTTTAPKVTTSVPVPTTAPKVTTSVPVATTAPKVTTSAPVVTSPLHVTTTVAATGPRATSTSVAANLVTTGGKSGSPTLTTSPSGQVGAGVVGVPSSAMLFRSGVASSGSSAAAFGLRTHVTALRTLRPFLVLRGRARTTPIVLVFDLADAGRVRLTLVRVFPDCRRIGSLSVRGHRGTNRIKLGPRLNGRPLRAGTYQIGVVNKRGALLRTTTAIFASERPTGTELDQALQRNACGPVGAGASAGGRGLTGPGGATSSVSRVSGVRGSQQTRAGHGKLGASSFSPARIAGNLPRSPLGFLLLIVAATMLAATAVPPRAFAPHHGRLATAYKAWRVELVVAAFAVLIGDLIVLALA